MQEIQYKTFSLKTHKKNWHFKIPNVCQFELTFKCGLYCKHCYTDCYNKAAYFKRELNTRQVKLILDKAYKAGIIWVCFTGGDPLTRGDFLDIYAYAKEKGFIITVFTNGYSMTEEIAGYLEKKPPFVIEITLNAVTEDLYDKISRVEGSFAKVMRGIDLILKAKISLKIKTQITKDNLEETPKIRKYIEGLGLEFRPSYDLYARLNRDLAPCHLRISAQEILSLNGDKRALDDCRSLPRTENREPMVRLRSPSALSEVEVPSTEHRAPSTALFRCAIAGGDGIHIDPCGNMFSCILIRKPAFNLLKVDVDDAQKKLLSLVRDKKFAANSKCNECSSRESCNWCPGRAYVETGDMEAPIEYYCQLTKGVFKCPESQNLVDTNLR